MVVHGAAAAVTIRTGVPDTWLCYATNTFDGCTPWSGPAAFAGCNGGRDTGPPCATRDKQSADKVYGLFHTGFHEMTTSYLCWSNTDTMHHGGELIIDMVFTRLAPRPIKFAILLSTVRSQVTGRCRPRSWNQPLLLIDFTRNTMSGVMDDRCGGEDGSATLINDTWKGSSSVGLATASQYSWLSFLMFRIRYMRRMGPFSPNVRSGIVNRLSCHQKSREYDGQRPSPSRVPPH